MAQITQKLGFKATGAIRSLGSLSKKLDQANTSLRNFKGTADKAGMATRGLGGVQKSLDKTAKKTKNMTISWETMARIIETQIIVRSITILSQSLKDATERARELGLAIEEVQTISGRAKGSKELTQDILNLSDTLSSTPLDLAEGMYQTLSNQVVEAGEALNFTANASKLATVTASETGDAVNALSSVMNSYGKESSQAAQVSDTLFKTVELGRVRLNELADIIGRVTPLTSQLGITWEETAASIATMTRQGVRADTAITQLRAVVNKLIKPSEDMQKLYREWGVKTGKQAIETFGGLQGVLEKVMETTGGNTTEIAKLFKRVRATTGVISIMADEGDLLSESLDGIENSSEAAANAFEMFSRSDAHKMTLAIQEMENSLTRAGMKLMPTYTKLLEYASKKIDNFADGWLVITGGMTDAVRLADTYRKEVEKTQKVLDRRAERFAEEQRNRFEGLTKSVRQYYNSINKKELNLSQIRADAIDRASSKYKSSLDGIVSTYEDAVKRIGKAVENANDRIKSNSQEVANIQQRIEEKKLKGRLSKTQDVYSKLRILDEEYSKAQAEAREATSEIDYTKESKERAKAAREVALGYAEQAEQLAGQTGHLGYIQKYRDRTIRELKGMQKIEKTANEKIKARLPDLKEQLEIRKKELTTLKDLVKQFKDLTQEGLIDSDVAVDRVNEIGEKITDILGSAENSKFFMDSLKLEEQTGVIKDGLQTAFDSAKINWEVEVKRARKAFEGEVIKIKTIFDPKGETQRRADVLGVEKRPDQTISEFEVQLLEKAKEELNKQATLIKEMDDIRDKNESKLKTALSSEQAINKAIEDQAINIRHSADANSLMARQSGIILNTESEFNRLLKQKKPLLHNVKTGYEDIYQKLKAGKEVQTKEINVLSRQILKAAESKDLTEDHQRLLFGVINKLREWSEVTQEIADKQKQMPEKERLEAAKQTVEMARRLNERRKKGVDLTEEGTRKMKGLKGTLDSIQESTNDFNTSLGTSKEQATSVKNGVASIGTVIDQNIGKAKALAAALAQAASAASAASAGPAGPAMAHFGGSTKYFAAGGTARGQDKIPAMLGKDETVISARNSKRFFSELNAMNQGSQPVYREQGGSVTNVGDVNVTVNGGDSSQQTVREIGHALRREIQRGNIKLR